MNGAATRDLLIYPNISTQGPATASNLFPLFVHLSECPSVFVVASVASVDTCPAAPSLDTLIHMEQWTSDGADTEHFPA